MAEKKADIGGKRLVSLDPTNWVKWVSNNTLEAKEVISSDFQWVSRENDVLIRSYHPTTKQEILVLNELQLRYDNDMPL